MPRLNRCLILAAAWLAGCATTIEDRGRSAAAFTERLKAETDAYFADHPEPLALTDAFALARARTLRLTAQDLEARLARTRRAQAFSAFLPDVEASLGRFTANGDVTAAPYLRVRDGKDWGDEASVTVTQPVFAPVAWTMFVESNYGVRIADLVRERARELLDVQVAACFYKAAIAERMVETYRLQLESGEALVARVAKLADEGYALPAEKARAEARVAADALGLRESRNRRDKARSDLCGILSLWPLAEFRLNGDSILEIERVPWHFIDTNGVVRAVSRDELAAADCAEFVWQGLLQRKDLYAGDETVNLRKAQVVEALAGFLPNVVLGGGATHLTYGAPSAKGWFGGIAGTWAAFEGFRSVEAYFAAKARREAEYQLQEDRMLAVVTSVADAWRGWRETEERVRVARKVRAAAALDWSEAQRRYEDGQETLSRVLDKLAAKDAAEVQAVSAEYAAALAEVTLRQAMGLRLHEGRSGDEK